MEVRSMRLGIILLFTAALSIFPAVFNPAEAFWDRNGNLVSGTAGEDTSPHLVPDGAGGMIIVWRDSSADIYAQRMDGTGAPMWEAGGVYIASGGYYIVDMVADGEGGAIVVWFDSYTDLLRAARILPDGSLSWHTGYVTIGTTGSPTNWSAAPDGSGGVLVAWLVRNGGDHGFIQKIDKDGAALWSPGGFQYSNVYQPNDAEYFPDVVSDGAGGALIAFTDNNTPTNVYAQRVYSNESVWSSSGTHANYVSGLTSNGINPCIALDGAGGAYVAWHLGYLPGGMIKSQIIDPAGGRVLASPVDVSGTVGGECVYPDIISDGTGGAYITWQEYFNGRWRIFAQRVDSYIHSLWAVEGIVLNDETAGDQKNPRIMDAGSGDVVVAWSNELHGGPFSVHAQKLDAGGAILWNPDVTLIIPDGFYGNWDAACDGSGGVMAVIPKETTPGEVDIYAQSINAFGSAAAPEPVITGITDVPGDQGGSVRITIGSSDRDRLEQEEQQVSSYDIWQRVDGPVMLSGEIAVEGQAYLTDGVGADGLTVYTDGSRRFIKAAPGGAFPAGTWELVGSFGASQADEYIYRAPTLADSAGTSYNYSIYAVAAMTTNPSVWFVSAPDSGYSVDNLAPAPPLGLAGEQSYTPDGLQLTWDPNTENDLWYYAVYRGTGSLPVPSMAELVATPQSAEYFDGSWTWEEGYWYLVSAVDIHGNESGYVVLDAGQVTGDDPMPVPGATFLAQNWPNPFNPATTIAFGIKESGHVSLRIYDAAGRLVTTLIDEVRPAGSYSTEWNGESPGGSPAASGVYFYKLKTGEFEKTRKMILLR
jgi:hypothetical protein